LRRLPGRADVHPPPEEATNSFMSWSMPDGAGESSRRRRFHEALFMDDISTSDQ
jgi:hypothetical protein